MKKINTNAKFNRWIKLPQKPVVAGLVVLAVVAFAVSPLGKSTSFAAGNKQYCTPVNGTLACLNAWDGGPFVRVYTHLGAVNNTFQFGQAANGFWYLRYNGPSGWNGRCIGDAYNDPQNHVASLGVCPGTLSKPNGDWGTNFRKLSCGINGIVFQNVHTGKYLAPELGMNNSAFVIDGPPDCFYEH